jgi:hypothetical protein
MQFRYVSVVPKYLSFEDIFKGYVSYSLCIIYEYQQFVYILDLTTAVRTSNPCLY